MPEISTNYLSEINNSYKFLVVDVRIIKNLDIAIIIMNIVTVVEQQNIAIYTMVIGEALAHMLLMQLRYSDPNWLVYYPSVFTVPKQSVI